MLKQIELRVQNRPITKILFASNYFVFLKILVQFRRLRKNYWLKKKSKKLERFLVLTFVSLVALPSFTSSESTIGTQEQCMESA